MNKVTKRKVYNQVMLAIESSKQLVETRGRYRSWQASGCRVFKFGDLDVELAGGDIEIRYLGEDIVILDRLTSGVEVEAIKTAIEAKQDAIKDNILNRFLTLKSF